MVQASKVCMVCVEVDEYIDKFFKEINLNILVVGNQLLMFDQLKGKLKDDPLKRMVELRKLEELIDRILENFVVSLSRVATRLH